MRQVRPVGAEGTEQAEREKEKTEEKLGWLRKMAQGVVWYLKPFFYFQVLIEIQFEFWTILVTQ
jgi:hypothetical protein